MEFILIYKLIFIVLISLTVVYFLFIDVLKNNTVNSNMDLNEIKIPEKYQFSLFKKPIFYSFFIVVLFLLFTQIYNKSDIILNYTHVPKPRKLHLNINFSNFEIIYNKFAYKNKTTFLIGVFIVIILLIYKFYNLEIVRVENKYITWVDFSDIINLLYEEISSGVITEFELSLLKKAYLNIEDLLKEHLNSRLIYELHLNNCINEYIEKYGLSLVYPPEIKFAWFSTITLNYLISNIGNNTTNDFDNDFYYFVYNDLFKITKKKNVNTSTKEINIQKIINYFMFNYQRRHEDTLTFRLNLLTIGLLFYCINL